MSLKFTFKIKTRDNKKISNIKKVFSLLDNNSNSIHSQDNNNKITSISKTNNKTTTITTNSFMILSNLFLEISEDLVDLVALVDLETPTEDNKEFNLTSFLDQLIIINIFIKMIRTSKTYWIIYSKCRNKKDQLQLNKKKSINFKLSKFRKIANYAMNSVQFALTITKRKTVLINYLANITSTKIVSLSG